MTPDTTAAQVYTDFSGLAALKREAQSASPESLRAVAQQFEALFLQMVLKSMREASLADGIFDSDRTDFYNGMFDQQLALTLSSRRGGIGLADVLIRQLGGETSGAPASPAEPTRDAALNAALRPQLAPSVSPQEVADWRPPAAPAAAADRPAQRVAELDGTPEAFVELLMPHARETAQRIGVAPEAILAQAALESGWGAHVIRHVDGRTSHNLFGIKAAGGWEGETVSVGSLEYEAGAMVRRVSAFRAYGSYAESFADYARFLETNPRYADALARGADPAAFADALQRAGYATDPGYAEKIKSILSRDVIAQGVKNSDSGPLT